MQMGASQPLASLGGRQAGRPGETFREREEKSFSFFSKETDCQRGAGGRGRRVIIIIAIWSDLDSELLATSVVTSRAPIGKSYLPLIFL